jgi:hypothetical protein
MLIRKHGLSLLERQTMLSNVLLVLPLIPLKLKFAHIYIICTLYLFVKIKSHMSNVGISCGRVRRFGGPARRVLRRRRDGSGRQLYAELERSILPMPPFEQFGILLFVARIVYSTAKCIENTPVYASSLVLAQLSIHSFRILIPKLRRIIKSNLPEMPSQIRPNPGYVLQ